MFGTLNNIRFIYWDIFYILISFCSVTQILSRKPNVDSSAAKNSPQQIKHFLLFVW